MFPLVLIVSFLGLAWYYSAEEKRHKASASRWGSIAGKNKCFVSREHVAGWALARNVKFVLLKGPLEPSQVENPFSLSDRILATNFAPGALIPSNLIVILAQNWDGRYSQSFSFYYYEPVRLSEATDLAGNYCRWLSALPTVN